MGLRVKSRILKLKRVGQATCISCCVALALRARAGIRSSYDVARAAVPTTTLSQGHQMSMSRRVVNIELEMTGKKEAPSTVKDLLEGDA